MDRGVILVVEDDALVARSLQRSLGKTRPCMVVHGVEQGLSVVTSEPCRLSGVLVDVNLLDGSGFDVVEAFKKHRPSQGAAVLMSGKFEQDIAMINRAFSLGCHFVTKPLSGADIKRILVDVVAFDVLPEERVRSVLIEIARSKQLSPRESDLVARAVMHEPIATTLDVLDITYNTYASIKKRILAKLATSSLDLACREILIRASK
jgi:FixJ family two-component response regulator